MFDDLEIEQSLFVFDETNESVKSIWFPEINVVEQMFPMIQQCDIVVFDVDDIKLLDCWLLMMLQYVIKYGPVPDI